MFGVSQENNRIIGSKIFHNISEKSTQAFMKHQMSLDYNELVLSVSTEFLWDS